MRLSESDIKDLLDGSTFGIELEIANCNATVELPVGNTFCTKEGSVINKNRVGNDPLREYNHIGCEIQVKPHDTEEELLKYVLYLLHLTQCEEIRDPNTFHSHIKIPKLLLDENVGILRHIINYSNKWNSKLMPLISHLPPMDLIMNQKYHSPEQAAMFKRAYKDKYRSRHSILPESSIARINNPEIKTRAALINAMAPAKKNGSPSWFVLPRNAVNFRKMRDGDIGTIEVRCFSGSSDPEVIRNIIEFPRLYVTAALLDIDPIPVFKDKKWPGYYGWTMETNEESMRWIKTDHDKVDRKLIIPAIKEMLINREITLGSLGYPETFWNRQLGDKLYYELLNYSKEVGIEGYRS